MTNSASFIYFANWMGKPVQGKNGRVAGHFWDLEINPQEQYPSVTAVILYKGLYSKQFAEVPWSQTEYSNGELRLKISSDQIEWKRVLGADVFRIRKDILDQQLVDTYNHKVIRVNDVHLLAVHPWRLVHVDIGTRALVRRLGYARITDWLVRKLSPSSAYLAEDHLLSWKFVKAVSLDPHEPIHIDLSAGQLASIPPADLGELLMDLDIHQRVALFRTADIQQRARLFERLDFDQQEQLIEHLTTREAVELLQRMSADEAVDLLGGMAEEPRRQFLALMETNRARRLSQLLGYEEDEAGGIMTTEYMEIPSTATVENAIALVREKTRQLETIYYLYVLSDNKQLVGTTTLRQLIMAAPQTPIAQTMYKPLFVYLHTPIKEVAFLMDKYKVSALPVVNKEKQMQGIITVDDVLHHVIPIAWRRRKRKRL